MELWVSKVACLFLLLIICLVFGLLPIRLVAYLRKKEQEDFVYRRRFRTQSKSTARVVLSFLNCFSGGVFLGVCLLHLFPETQEQYNLVKKKANIQTDFPLSELIISFGFFLVMVIEHAVMSCHHHEDQHNPGVESANHAKGYDEIHGSHQTSHPTNTYGALESGEEERKILLHHNREETETHAADIVGSLENIDNNEWVQCDAQPPHHHHPGQTHEETEKIHGIRSLTLLFALSLHTLFEGMALGLQTDRSQVWTLFLALAIHKCIISFTLGLQFTDTFQQMSRVIVYIVVFSIINPIGVAIGTGISAVHSESLAMSATSMVLQSVATGTFLYVTFFEVLQKEISVEEHNIKKVFAIIVGFIGITLTCFLG